MSNPLATDAYVPQSTDIVYYLESTKEGVPVNKQVPRTYQKYTGTGGTLIYDGSNEIRVNGSALLSPLIIQFGPLTRIRNLIGRLVVLNIYTPNTQTITLNSSPALMVINSTALTQLSHVIAASPNTKSITIYFSDTTLLNVDYGSAAIGSIIPQTPGTANMAITYVYGTDNTIALPCIYIPDNTSYGVTIVDPEPTTEGIITPFIGSVAGPGTQNVIFFYQPAPRRSLPTTVNCYLSSSGNVIANFTVTTQPILTNVYDKEYITAAISDGRLAMYDPLVNLGGVPRCMDALGSEVIQQADMVSVCVDILDSLVFYTTTASNTIIKWKSYTTYKEGDLLDVSSLTTGFWTTGDTIVDIDFDDKTSSLLVLPNNPNLGKILSIPIKPYRNEDPGNVYTGVLNGSNFSVGAGAEMHSIAVCPFTRQIYIACRPPALFNSIIRFAPFPVFGAGVSYQQPGINTGRTAITFSSQGTFFMLYERTLELWKVNSTYGLSLGVGATTMLYSLSQYHTSLSRNCYGWFQQ